MSENEPFGRQLKPVIVTITDADIVDHDWWARKIRACLENQPCNVSGIATTAESTAFRIYPDANND